MYAQDFLKESLCPCHCLVLGAFLMGKWEPIFLSVDVGMAVVANQLLYQVLAVLLSASKEQ